MSSTVCKKSKYDIQQWLIQLHNAGFDKYYHHELPEHLKNINMHRSAIRRQLIKHTGKRTNASPPAKQWQLPKDILTANPNYLGWN